jgi:hypothetical protein
MIKSFPKVFSLGQNYIGDILQGEIEITEKVDGSQFSFGLIDGELYCRSKGADLNILQPEKMFKDAVNYILSIESKMPNNTVFYCEYLKSPKHNVLKYERIPKNTLCLFAVYQKNVDLFYCQYSFLQEMAELLSIDCIPLLGSGEFQSLELDNILDTESYLGGAKIEGFVVKNYKKPFLLGGQPIPIMCGKYVSEGFKEIHKKSWSREHTGIGKWEQMKESYRTEARWHKSVQHLTEKGELEGSPRDIGKLLIEVKRDITEECQEDIKKFLWREYGEELLRYSIKGFPEFYKRYLAKDIIE